jgi:MEDS: MEthanogen/methylotroph, DcmR Sensory domain
MNPTKANTESREADNPPMRFANATLGQYRHVCAFFHGTEEEYRVLLPFVKEGLARGEKAFHIVDPELRDEHLERLASGGVDVHSVDKSGQFELHHWHEVYLRDGHFDVNRMLGCMQDVLEQSERDGFPLARVMGHAEWASGDWPGVDDFLEYECRLNDIIPKNKDAVICLYNLTKCGGNLIIDVMRTHPMILIGGIVQENPFFVPPDEFLRELRERRAPRNKVMD